MKKRYKILVVVSLIIGGLAYWIIEPYNFNPFSDRPIALAISEIDFASSTDPDYGHRFKAKADSLLDNSIIMNDYIGVSAGVYKADCGTWLGNAGFANKQDQIRPNKETLFRVASLTKPMTAIAIMQLYEKGKIKLDVPIQTYLSEFPVKLKGDITIRQLLKHTSGVKHYSSTWDGISFTHYSNMVQALDEFKDRPLSFEPGSGYEYSTYGYTILGAIIEKVTGGSYQEYMRTNVFLPAGMTHADIEKAGTFYHNKANLYININGTYIKSPKTDLSVKYPAGGFHSTAEDFLKFGKAILENKLIDSTTLNLMITNTDNLKQGTPYGLGWFVLDDDDQGKTILHGGAQSGTSSFFQISLDQKIVSVSLANDFGSDGGVQWMVRKLANLIDDPAMIDRAVAYSRPQPQETLEKYIGTFKGGDKVFEITMKGSQLFSKLNDYPPFPMFSKSPTEFFFRAFDSEIKYTKNEHGEFVLNYLNGSASLVCQRILN